jgi:hypothetical protein
LAIADARARAAGESGDSDVDELQERAAALAKTALDKFGPTWDVGLERERVAMQVAGVRAGMVAVRMSEEQRTVFVEAMLARLRVVGREEGT